MSNEICLVCSGDKDDNSLVLCSECNACSCGSCGKTYKQEEGILLNNEGKLEFVCATCFEEDSVCGACGQFFPIKEAETDGFHSAKYCEQANWDVMVEEGII